MDNWFLLYLLTRLDIFIGLAIAFAIMPGAFVVFATVYSMIPIDKYSWTTKEDIEEAKNRRATFVKWRTWAFGLFVAGVAMGVLVPSKSDVFFIVGGSTLIEAVHSDTAKRIGSKSLEAVESWLDQNMPKKAEPAK